MRIISSRVKGMVGLFGTFGALSSVAGLSSIHFLFSAKRMNALSRSNFLRVVRGPSFHVARKVASVSRSNWVRNCSLYVSAKPSSCRNSRRYLYSVESFSFRVLDKLPMSILDRNLLLLLACAPVLSFPLADHLLRSLSVAEFQLLINLCS